MSKAESGREGGVWKIPSDMNGTEEGLALLNLSCGHMLAVVTIPRSLLSGLVNKEESLVENAEKGREMLDDSLKGPT